MFDLIHLMDLLSAHLDKESAKNSKILPISPISQLGPILGPILQCGLPYFQSIAELQPAGQATFRGVAL